MEHLQITVLGDCTRENNTFEERFSSSSLIFQANGSGFNLLEFGLLTIFPRNLGAGGAEVSLEGGRSCSWCESELWGETCSLVFPVAGYTSSLVAWRLQMAAALSHQKCTSFRLSDKICKIYSCS